MKRICDNISAALQSSVRRTFAVRQHLGPQLSSFEPVTAEEVRKLLSSMFTPAIARLTNLSLQTGKFPARYKRAQVLSTAEEGRTRQFTASELQADLQPADRSKVLERLVLARLRPHLLSSANFSQF